MERENLAGDAKGKGTSGSNREAESTDAPERVRPGALSGLAEPFASASRSLPLRQIQDSKPVLIYPSELNTTAMRLN
jgi:hypothetical protein